MYSRFQLAIKYIRYYVTASNGKGHGIHSPFVFRFITDVLNDSRRYPEYDAIEKCRQQLLRDNNLVETIELGAGSSAGAGTMKRVSQIARWAAKPPKLSQLLFRIARYYQSANIIELGTSLGLSAAYLATANGKARVLTIEGSPAVAAIARRNLAELGITNVELLTGNFDDILGAVLQRASSVDLAFIDGNHRKEPTLRYFSQLLSQTNSNTILIFDDIHWSAEMEKAWEEIRNHSSVMLTIDLFFLGLVFFHTDFKVKQHFVIRF